jgi:serine/threonine protein kinase
MSTFQILKKTPLGESKYNEVFRVEVEGHKSAFALKTLKAIHHGNRSLRTRFSRNPIVWSRNPHRNLLNVVEAEEESTSVVLELMPESVQSRLLELPLPSREGWVAEMLRGALEGLSHIHSMKQLHLNLKPSNLFIDSSGICKLADGYNVSLPADGMLPLPTGSRRYLSPEQIRDEELIGPATDIYALGMIATEALVGRAFESHIEKIQKCDRDDSTFWYSWHADSANANPDLLSLEPELPSMILTIVDKMICKEVENRFANAKEVLQAMDDAELALPSADQLPAAAKEPSPAILKPKPELTPKTTLRVLSGPKTGRRLGLVGESNKLSMSKVFGEESMTGEAVMGPCVLECCINQARTDEPDTIAWQIENLKSQPFVLNGVLRNDNPVIEDGDIIRMGPVGPDLQMVLPKPVESKLADIKKQLGTISVPVSIRQQKSATLKKPKFKTQKVKPSVAVGVSEVSDPGDYVIGADIEDSADDWNEESFVEEPDVFSGFEVEEPASTPEQKSLQQTSPQPIEFDEPRPKAKVENVAESVASSEEKAAGLFGASQPMLIAMAAASVVALLGLAWLFLKLIGIV